MRFRAQSEIKPAGVYTNKYDLLVQLRVRANPHYFILSLCFLSGQNTEPAM